MTETPAASCLTVRLFAGCRRMCDAGQLVGEELQSAAAEIGEGRSSERLDQSGGGIAAMASNDDDTLNHSLPT